MVRGTKHLSIRQVFVMFCIILASILLASCASPASRAGDDHGRTPDRSDATGGSSSSASVRPLTKATPADLLVRDSRTLPSTFLRKARSLGGVTTTLGFAAGHTTLNGHRVTVAAVDPSKFRAYAPTGTAESDPLWASVARGELAVMHRVAKRLDLTLGGRAKVASSNRRIGAFATTLPGVDVVVNDAVGRQLGLHPNTGLVASVGSSDPGAVGQRLTKLVGRLAGRADVDLLGAPKAVPKSFVSGKKAAKAFGTFSYRYSANGTITPDSAWVRANIRTERVPIIGKVTCHRLMLPQLRGALSEVVESGLADKIHAGEYAGCYVPRFIENNPNRSISLHTWGIAADLNVPGNQRGTKGKMDRRVVAIFKKWGFAWGGDWRYTDPMHFELAALRKSASG